MPDAPSPADDPIAFAWLALSEPAHWTDDARHAAFVALALSLDRLADAGTRYRTALADPLREPVARAGIDRVLAAAMARIDTAPRSNNDGARRLGRLLVPLVLYACLVALSFLAAALTHNHVFKSPLALALELAIVALLPWRRLPG